MFSNSYLFTGAFIASLLTATPVFASCNEDLELVTAGLETVKLSEADRAKVEEYKASAASKQQAGDENGCAADLFAAKAILQLN